MQVLLETLMVIGFITAPAGEVERLDELFTSWREAQQSVRSLIVEFTQERRDAVFNERQKADGSFRLIRTPNGEVFASCEILQLQPTGKQERWSGLLYNATVYLLNHDKKTAIRLEPADEGVGRFLEKYFNPFIVFLDLQRAREEYQIEVVKQDEWYTYLSMKPNQDKQFSWFSTRLSQGRAALMNKASAAVPKNMPCRLWHSDGVTEWTFDIKAWRLNVADAPKQEEFIKPEDRPGWEVSEWPFRAKK